MNRTIVELIDNENQNNEIVLSKTLISICYIVSISSNDRIIFAILRDFILQLVCHVSITITVLAQQERFMT